MLQIRPHDSPRSTRKLRRPSPGYLFLLLVLGLLIPATGVANPLDDIRQRYTAGLEAYDFFEYDAAEASFNEAIEIAKKFSNTDASSFINGLLDQIASSRN